MAAKKTIAPPIDRPLARAYLRKFTGWSTAYPPGLSDPTSLQTMHNCSIAADGSVRIRPGLRRIFTEPADGDIVGSFEHFYISRDEDQPAAKALLFAVREADDSVGFRVAWDPDDTGYMSVVNASTIFTVRSGDDLNFQRPDIGKGEVTYVRYVQIDNKVLALSNNDESFRLFQVGAEKKASVVRAITRPNYNTTDRPTVLEPAESWITGAQNTVPSAQTASTTQLVSSDTSKNIYTFAYFYTFNNEIGETAPSMTTMLRVQRRWTNWITHSTSDALASDQLACIIPQAAWDAAKAQGAVSWNLYFLTWSAQDPVPIEGIGLKTIDMVGKTYQQAGWATHTPLLQGNNGYLPLPNPTLRENYTEPSSASQGLVAGDRLVLVGDPLKAARITWSSNQQGDYLNFSSAKGGGYKTLTSGNLFVPATVKLWQNPQSVDTLTVLCRGLDGYGTAYYMNPSTSVQVQNQATLVMGFEETTATPGTVSPYGVEILNNVLYHPLDNNLMKSTASNYNINHALMADAIQNVWRHVSAEDKRKIVSSQMDSTLYYLVRSVLGTEYPVGAEGNQLWMCDTALSGAWSCWDIVGSSLRKLEMDGLLHMGVTCGPNIFVFDQEQDHDDEWDGTAWVQRGIPWEIVTNTQGANKAHDAWCRLQQVNVTFGNFTGECIYGIRGKDIHGQPVEVSKHFISQARWHSPLDRFDQEDMLLVQRDLKEWQFFWRSAPKPKKRSYGSVNYVQYRYAPISVNVGYAFGSVETFEYGQRDSTFSNAIPIPFADTNKP